MAESVQKKSLSRTRTSLMSGILCFREIAVKDNNDAMVIPSKARNLPLSSVIPDLIGDPASL